MSQIEWASFEIDSWSEIVYCRKYLGIHIYFTKTKGALSNNGLFIYFKCSTESETSEFLTQSLRTVMRKYLPNDGKTISVISDRGSNVKNVAASLNLLAQFCYDHLTHNVVTTVLKSMNCSIELRRKVGKTTSQFTRSTKANSLLESLQEDTSDYVLHVKSVIDNRWGSFYTGGLRLLGMGSAISQTLNQLPKAVGTLSNFDLRLLHHVLLSLQPLKEFSDRVGDRELPNHISIVQVLSSSVQLFLKCTKHVLLEMQQFWTESDMDMKTAVDLDANVEETNWLGLSTAFAIILLQYLRHYFFKTILDRLTKDSKRVELALVGASLDSSWEKCFKLASETGLLSSLNRHSVLNIVEKDFNNQFLAAVLQAHSEYTGTAPDVLATVADRIQNLSEDDAMIEETITPLVDVFEKLDLEDMSAIVINLHAQFVADISFFNDSLSTQLQMFSQKFKLEPADDISYDLLVVTGHQSSTNFTSFSSYSSFSDPSELAPTKYTSSCQSDENNTINTISDQNSSNAHWEELRRLCHSLPPTNWKMTSPSIKDRNQRHLRNIHRALDTVRSASSGLERNFSDATGHQVDQQSNLASLKFGMEVQIARNYCLMGFDQWYQDFHWGERIPNVVSEKMLLYHQDPSMYNNPSSSNQSSPSTPLISSTPSMTNLISSPTPSRSDTAISLFSSPSIPSLTSESSSISSLQLQSTTTHSIISETLRADNFLSRVYSNGTSFLITNQSQQLLSTNADKEMDVVQHLKELSKKRSHPEFPDEDTEGIKEWRKSMLNYLKQDINESEWDSMLDDVACRLSTDKKFYKDLFIFARTNLLIPQMVVKLRSILLSNEDCIVGMKVWMEDHKQTEPQMHVPLTGQTLPNFNFTQEPIAGSAERGFRQLPNARIIDVSQQESGHSVADSLEANLLANNLKEFEAGGGGDCFFKATAHCLLQQEVPVIRQLRKNGLAKFTPTVLRHVAVRIIRQGWEAYDAFRTNIHGGDDPEPKEEWLAEMNRSGRWADNITIQALSDNLGIHFIILRSNGSIIHIHPSTGEVVCTVTLTLHGECHYRATEPI